MRRHGAISRANPPNNNITPFSSHWYHYLTVSCVQLDTSPWALAVSRSLCIAEWLATNNILGPQKGRPLLMSQETTFASILNKSVCCNDSKFQEAYINMIDFK